MSGYDNLNRKTNLYDTQSAMPFRLSRSKFESFERLSSGRQRAMMR